MNTSSSANGYLLLLRGATAGLRWNLYEAILFDFDGVLIDSEPVHFTCWRDILKEFGVDLDWDTYERTAIGVSDRKMLAGLCGDRIDLEALYARYPQKKAMFRERMMAGETFTRDTLQLLHDLRGFQLAVVTSSGRAEVEPILEAAGIRECFHAAVFGGDVKNLKPAPDPYLLAVERLSVKTAIVVEDSDAGCESARAAGLPFVRVPRQADMPGLVRAALAQNHRNGHSD